MAPLIIGRPDQKGSTGRDNRMFVEGVLWIVRTGSPWRDLPEVFGDWNSVFRRFSRWSIKGVWYRMFEAMSDDPDFEYRTGVLESEVIKPLILCLLDPEGQPMPEAQVAKALDAVESWMVRRMLVRATTKNYNLVVAALIAQVR